MSALATLLIIVPLAALQPYRPAAAPQSGASATPARSSVTVRASAVTADSSVTASDLPLSQRLQSLDSARTALSAKQGNTDAALGTQDTARARIASSSAGAEIETKSGPEPDDDSCERFQYGNSSQSSFHMHSNDDGARGTTVRYLDFDQSHCRAASITGKIVTTAEENRVIALTPMTARASFRERTGRFDREITYSYATTNDARTLTPLYRVNGVEAPFDDDGRRWLAELLPRVLAEASINVEPRVARWRVQEGVDGALRHIADLRSSGAKRAHYDVLLDDNQLSAAELDRLVKQSGKDIPSSGDLRAVLSKAASRQNRGKVSGSTLEEAMGAIPSSGDLTSVLLAFGQTDDREQLLAVARTALKIPSSGDLSRFLVELAPRYLGRDDTALRGAYFKAVANIPSSGDLARVLVNAVPFAAKSPAIAQAVIAAAGTVPASGDRANVLVALAGSGAVRGAALRDAYLKAASEIASSTDMRRALVALTGN